ALTEMSPSPQGRAIAVFARVPEPGLVKTRLIPELGADGAAALHAHLIEATLGKARAVAGAGGRLWLTGAIDRYVSPPGTAWTMQGGADLGARMSHAFIATRARARACVLMGTDCPALQPVHLRRAFEELDRNDVVVIPAEDGGYVLIALTAPQPRLFEDI